MMTKKELIEALKNFPDSTRILIQGYEGGFSDIGLIAAAKVTLNYHKEDWNGPHEVLPSANEQVVIINRAANPNAID